MNYQPDLISTSLRMFVALALILGGLLVVLYYTKRKFKNKETGSNGKLIRVLGNTYIGMKKHISLVEVPGAILVLGITNDNISLLTKVEDDAIAEKLRKQGGEIPSSFSEQLLRLSLKFKNHKHEK
jgi:flagellar protein FliO/FliZ